MNVRKWTRWGAALVLGIMLTEGGLAAAGESPSGRAIEGPADAKTVLGAVTPWRWHTSWSKPFVSVEALKAAGKEGQAPIPLVPKIAFYRLGNDFEKPEVVPPPSGWTGPDFDDAGWTRTSLPISDNQFIYTPLVSVRGRFMVSDPNGVKGLHLALNYRGGAVVYLNGQEVARLDLPVGEVAPATPGRLYPEEAWVDAAGKALPPPQDVKPEHKDRLAKRERRGGPVELPIAALRRGVNVLAIELHRSDLHPTVLTWWDGEGWKYGRYAGWAPIGLSDVRLTATGEGFTPNLDRPAGIQVWNTNPFGTVTALDYGDAGVPLRPVRVPAARNGVFSGRLVVSSDQAIKGLKVTVSDLAQAGGDGKIPASAVRVRYAEPAVAVKTWVPAGRFDGLLDAVPTEIPAPPPRQVGKRSWGAMAPLWFTVKVPKDAKPGKYEGSVSIVAEGLAPTTVPLWVDVSAWTVPDPKDFRVQNFAYLSEDSAAKHYGVPMWSDRHFELMGKSLALMAEINSRQAIVNLAVDFYGVMSNEQTMVRWIRQADGSYVHDFSIFDRYLDVVARTMGKPTLLRLNCWGEPSAKGGPLTGGQYPVTLLDPTTGKIERMVPPVPGTEESLGFWKPVLDEARKKIEARGWFDVTAVGHNSYCTPALPQVVSVYKRIWPDGVWSYTAHNGGLGGSWAAAEKGVSVPVRYADCVWTLGRLTPRGYRALLKPRPGIWCFTFRDCFRVQMPLTVLRTVIEEGIMRGHDGLSDFGADLFPIKNPATGRLYCLGNGRGTGGPNCTMLAMLAPGPDGPISTERFEVLREGVELDEAILFVARAVEEKKISGDLEQRANRLLDERGESVVHEVARRSWLPTDRFEQDAKLLALAAEVAAAISGK